MDFLCVDYNGADEYYAGEGRDEWSEMESILASLVPQLQPHGEAGLEGEPNFDPKATNRELTNAAEEFGWRKVAVPRELAEFGTDWDVGKGGTLAEFQFSHYAFLWNNIIRTEIAYRAGWRTAGATPLRALLHISKSALLPSSKSSLYFEQAVQQVESAAKVDAFTIPIRLIGLTVPDGESFPVDWNTYPGRTSRTRLTRTRRTASVEWLRTRNGDRPYLRVD